MSPPFPVAAGRYEAFRHRIWSLARLVVCGGERPFRDELDLQAQWFGGEFGRVFTGTENEKIEIVQFGHWNRGAGPDFTEVAVRINGELRRGAVEVDVDVRNWERHGHLINPDFNEVVLHVFTDQPAMNRFFTQTEDHRNIHQLLLPQFTGLEGRPDFLPEAFPGRCVAPLSRMSDAEVDSLLVAAAQHRLRRKSERLRVMVDSTSGEQAMFQAFAEALGFRQNKTAMAILAQRCPVRSLLAMGKGEREARLFGAAGFLDPGFSDTAAADDARAYLRQLWDHWWKMRDSVEPSPRRAINWRYDGTRPLNHPQRRVGALAGLVDHWEQLRPIWEENVNNLEKRANKLLKELSHPFWEHHYTLSSEPSPAALRLVGKDRLRDILGNVIFPGAIGLEPSYWGEYAALGRVDSNQKLRRATLRLFGSDSQRQKLFTRYYHQQQGLLQIYEDFCLEDASDCRNCPFPEQLTQWRGLSPSPAALAGERNV
jgi:hypothetical protein